MAYESAKPSAAGSKSSNKLAAAAAQEKKSGQPTSSSEVALQECEAVEEAILALKVISPVADSYGTGFLLALGSKLIWRLAFPLAASCT